MLQLYIFSGLFRLILLNYASRIAQVILEQNYDEQQKVLSKMIRVYAPFWFSIARCPSLTLRLLDLSGKKQTRKVGLPFRSKKNDEVVLEEITEEEIYEGHTIASTLNFKLLGMSVSISQFGNQQHGPAKDLSALGDMVSYILCKFVRLTSFLKK